MGPRLVGRGDCSSRMPAIPGLCNAVCDWCRRSCDNAPPRPPFNAAIKTDLSDNTPPSVMRAVPVRSSPLRRSRAQPSIRLPKITTRQLRNDRMPFALCVGPTDRLDTPAPPPLRGPDVDDEHLVLDVIDDLAEHADHPHFLHVR